MKSLRTSFASLLLVVSLVPACKSGTADSDMDAGIGGSSGNGTDTEMGGSSGNGGEAGSGGSAGGAGTTTGDLAIVGSYASSFDAAVTISEDRYLEVGDGYELDQEIVSFDNDEQFFVTRDPAAAEGAQFSKVVWVEADGVFYTCTALFGQETAADAAGADEADPEDLETGCGGFSWTALTPGAAPIAIAGDYTSSFDANVTITDARYLEQGEGYELDQEIVAYDNGEQYFVTLDATAVEYSKYVWVVEGDAVYLCTALFGQETAEDAAGPDEADPEDLDTGCGGFSWTQLTAGSAPNEDDGPDAG